VWLRDGDEGKGEGCCRGLRWVAGTKKRPARWENIKRDMTIYGNVTQSFSSTVAAAAEANVPFSFPFSFSFSYLNFQLFLVGFSIDVDSPRSFVWLLDVCIPIGRKKNQKKN
jgi:hypothetical protein